MKLEKIGNASVLSSDLNFGTLIYAEKDGSVSINNSKVITDDPAKKYVKFYPPDCYVFTSTDSSGLRVWDVEQACPIYSYKTEHLIDHCYSPTVILSSFDEFNLKFYDLRVRYMIASKPVPDTKKIGWINDRIYYLSGKSLLSSDFKNLKHDFFKIENVLDFAVCNDRFYYLSKEGSSHVLYSCLLTSFNKLEKMKKSVPYENIQSTLGGNAIVSFLKNKIRIEKFDNFQDISLGQIEAVAFHSSDLATYLFSDDALYKLAGSINDIFL